MQHYLNNPIDISSDFRSSENEFYLPASVTEFDVAGKKGKIRWEFHRYSFDWFFNKIDRHLQKLEDRGAPFQDYDLHPECGFEISFVSSSTIRLKMKTTTARQVEHPSLMIQGDPEVSKDWKFLEGNGEIKFESDQGYLLLNKDPFSISLFNSNGKLLFATQSAKELRAMHSKARPFCFMRRSTDYSRSMAASFSLAADEKIYGCGESFTAINKRGQKLDLFTTDAQSTASSQMYKPIPFFFSSRGYGMFVHTSSPCTFDFGYTHQGSTTLYIGEDLLDIFIFMGNPQQILHEYTALTGRSPLPPLWSFGLWMSRFSYRSQLEVLQVAENLRKHQVPCDVIHIDAGWFKKGINCDFEFCRENFPDPSGMMKKLKDEGFHTSLWQIPYFTPLNPVFGEVVERSLFVKDGDGNVPGEDAILDFSNEKTKEWYSNKIRKLFELGASVIKADFGEAAPLKGSYASGRSGFHEHNLYPLRYNSLLGDLTKEQKDYTLIWARSAWAGSQRYPLHWGGDAEVSDAGMAGTLRGGLSLGLSGFSFWSHDIGGFSGEPEEELFLRWSFFGLLSSHSRVHGFPPREPWEFSENFLTTFRKMVELRYSLLPYIYTQSALACEKGLPVLKPLLLNYPDDASVWNMDDQYLLGNDLLVAPLLEKELRSRKVYLPRGNWIDYFTGEKFEGERWHDMNAGELPGILLVASGTIIPRLKPALSTAFADWNTLEKIAYGEQAKGLLYQNGSFISL